MTINVEVGDLFKLPKDYSLGQCISLDCQGGRGIINDFYSHYPRMRVHLQREVARLGIQSPFVIPYKTDDNTIVFNLVTKDVVTWKPTYRTMESCIKEMADICRAYHITKLGLPLIGCGLDNLFWPRVQRLIERYFDSMDIDIQVRYIED